MFSAPSAKQSALGPSASGDGRLWHSTASSTNIPPPWMEPGAGTSSEDALFGHVDVRTCRRNHWVRGQQTMKLRAVCPPGKKQNLNLKNKKHIKTKLNFNHTLSKTLRLVITIPASVSSLFFPLISSTLPSKDIAGREHEGLIELSVL